MATKKISQLDLASALASGALFEISLDGVTYSCSLSQIVAFVSEAIAASGLDLTGASALGFKAFAVTDAPDDWDFGWGGDPVDLRYLRGLWFTLGLDYDPVYRTITHKEATKDETAVAIHLPSEFFAGEPFRGIAFITVQGTAARIAAGNVIGGGLPDRLLYPAYGAIGGYQMIKVFASNFTMAAAGSRDEIDGDGAEHGYDIRVHQKRSDDGSTQVWYTGRELNDSSDRPNTPAHPSARWGIRSTIDTTGSEPATAKVEFVVQYAEPTGDPEVQPSYGDVLAFELGTGLKLPAEQIGFDNTASGMTATDVQAALDEIEARVAVLEAA